MNLISNNTRTKIKDCDISYIFKGNSKKTLFFIHGLGCSKYSFEYAWEQSDISDNYNILALDLPGHGDSICRNTSNYTIQFFADVCAELLRTINVNDISIIGHSMGGAVALELIKLVPEKINSFICLEGNLTLKDCTLSLMISMNDENIFVNDIFPKNPDRFFHNLKADDSPPDPVALYRSSKSLVDISNSGNLLEFFQQLSIPKFYIYGEKSRIKSTLDKLQNIQTTCILNSGHFMMIDNPADTYEKISLILNDIK